MTRSMLVIVPTRGRPANVARLEQARRDTGAEHSDFMYAVDDDDPELMGYQAMGLSRQVELGRTAWFTGPRAYLGPTLNQLAVPLAGTFKYQVIGFMGDDHLPKTSGWDEEILETAGLADRPWIVYGNDLLQGANLPTAVFMPARVIRALGFMCPPQQRHLYLDNFWLELGQALGTLTYLPDVVIEHLHPIAGKAGWDPGYTEANSSKRDTADRAAWEDFRSNGAFAAAVERVRTEYWL